MDDVPCFGDTGGASRFFYVAKPSREERDYGCWDLRLMSGAERTGRKEGSAGLVGNPENKGQTGNPYSGGNGSPLRNSHPTVKPVELIRYLVKLITPPNGTCLDPFMGSGTTGMACRYELRQFIGIEREADYIAIAERRIAACAPLFGDEGEQSA
jgi:DNA modification methylase